MKILIGTLVALISWSAACQESEPVAVSAKDAYAKALLIISPIFPPNVSAEKLPVEVRVTGVVTTEGKFISPVFSPPEGNQEMVRAILDVLPEWRFKPAVDLAGCRSVDAPAVVIVYFELKDGKPSIAVSSSVAPTPLDAPDNRAWLRQHFSSKLKIEYPTPMLDRGVEGRAEALVQTNGEGKIIQKSVLYSLPSDKFGEAVINGLRWTSLAKDTRAASSSDGSACYIVPVTFCISTNNVEFPSPHCRHK